MTTIAPEFEELRIHIERLRTMLENLVVRGLRACGPDELALLLDSAQHLEKTGAGHVAAALHDLHSCIHADDRASAKSLLAAQTAVRLLERLLTLRVVAGHYENALAQLNNPSSEPHEEDEL